jgi:hypothetical protein
MTQKGKHPTTRAKLATAPHPPTYTFRIYTGDSSPKSDPADFSDNMGFPGYMHIFTHAATAHIAHCNATTPSPNRKMRGTP